MRTVTATLFIVLVASAKPAQSQPTDGIRILEVSATGKGEPKLLTLKYSGPHRPGDVKTPISDSDLTAFAKHPQLRDVEAIAFDGHMKLDGTGLAALGDMPKLKAVAFNGIAFKAVPFGPAGFDALAKMKGLEKVYVQHAVIPTAGAVQLLESLPNLQHFVPASIADDAILAAAAKAPNLRTLQFGHWATEPTRPLTAEGFAHYRKMKSVEKLVTGTVMPNDLE